MAKEPLYSFRGSLKDCLNYILQTLTTWPGQYINLVANDTSRYYGVVDDAFLEDQNPNPDSAANRLVLRCTKNEIESLYNFFVSLRQPDMFEQPKPDNDA